MIDILKPLIQQFMPFAQKEMGFNRPPKLFLRQDEQNAADPLGKTGFYDPQKESITIFTAGRHPKDVMRSLAHELMHHAQNCKGDFDNVENMGEQGYAQSNTHLRTMEIQAYQASIVFRDWEDSIKGTIYNESLQKGANENMSTKKWKNKEINTLLTERWGFKMDLGALNEGKDPAEEDPYGSGVDKTDSTPSTMEKAGKQETRGTATSKRGIPSAKGSVTHPKAGRIDRTDIANNAPAEWIKEGDKMRPFEPHEEALFEEASTTCNQRHQIQGDKAVRACIEEEMTRLMNEQQDLYEMCPHEEGPEGMELEFSPEGPEDVEISGLGAGDDGVEGAFERVQAALLDLAELAGLDLTGGDEEEVINVQESFDEEQIERLADHVYKIYKENLKR